MLVGRAFVTCSGLWVSWFTFGSWLLASTAFAQSATVTGTAHDETGGVLAGVSVELRSEAGAPIMTVTDSRGAFRVEGVGAGRTQITFTLITHPSVNSVVSLWFS